MDIKNFLVKNIIKSRHERFPLISVFGMLGIVVGVFAIITVISVMRGFESDLVRRLTGTQPHVYITDRDDADVLSNWDEIIDIIVSDERLSGDIISISPFVESEAIMFFDRTTTGVVIFSADSKFFDKMLIDEPGHREIVLGEQLAMSSDIIVADNVELVSAWDAATSSMSAPRTRTFTVVDLVRTGTYVRDLKYVYMNIDNAKQYFTAYEGLPSGVVMFCRHPVKIQEKKAVIEEILFGYGNIKVETWVDRNSRIFYSLKLERVAMMITLIFIVLIASFSIVVSLVLMVESKRRDFMVLMSMGLKKSTLKKVLLRVALIKGFSGSLLGAILATVFSILQREYGFISLPAIYYETRLPVDLNIGFNLLIVLMSTLVCLAGSLFPIRMLDSFSIASQIRKDS